MFSTVAAVFNHPNDQEEKAMTRLLEKYGPWAVVTGATRKNSASAFLELDQHLSFAHSRCTHRVLCGSSPRFPARRPEAVFDRLNLVFRGSVNEVGTIDVRFVVLGDKTTCPATLEGFVERALETRSMVANANRAVHSDSPTAARITHIEEN